MVIKNFGFDDDFYNDNFTEQFATQEKISPVVSQEEAERAASIANSILIYQAVYSCCCKS